MTYDDTPWLSEEQQQVWRDFLQLTGTLTEHLDRELRTEAGMPQSYYQVLAMLSEAPDRTLRMTDLATVAWSSLSRMSHAVTKLERLGWVERSPAPGDGRGQLVTLTDSGRRVLEDAAPSHVRSVRRILFEDLDPDLLEAFGAVCTRALTRLAETPSAAARKDQGESPAD